MFKNDDQEACGRGRSQQDTRCGRRGPRRNWKWIGLCAVMAMVFGAYGIRPAAAADAPVEYGPFGIGVFGDNTGGTSVPEQINHDSQADLSEALVIDFGAAVDAVEVKISRLFVNEQTVGECGYWKAYDGSGELVGEGFLNASTVDYVSDNVGFITIADSDNTVGPFRFLVFFALPYGCSGGPINSDSSDFVIESVTVDDITYGGLPNSPAAWEGVALSAFDFGTPFEANGRFVDAPFVVDDDECSGDGQNNTNCVLQLTDQCTTTIRGADVEGTITVAGVLPFIDFRTGCGFDGIDPQITLPGAIQPVSETDDGGLDLGFRLSPLDHDPAITGPLLPPHLCGIPIPGSNPGVGEGTVVDVRALDLTVVNSVLEHEIEDVKPGFSCATGQQILASPNPNDRRSRLTVLAWLPAFGEIPEFDGAGSVDPTAQDVTNGCGSARGGTRRLSYLTYNLRPAPGTEYRAVIRDEIARLDNTIDELKVCVDKPYWLILKAKLALISHAFERKQYVVAKAGLIAFLNLIATQPVQKQLAKCYFDLDPFPGFVTKQTTPPSPELEPLNAGGDLKVQALHLADSLDKYLGVVNPKVPARLQ